MREIIRELAREGMQTVSVVCTVDAVDAAARTVDCTPIDESAPLLGVNLQANQGSGFGAVLVPKVGSYVVVGFVSGGDAGVVLLTDEVERAELVIGGSSAVMDGEGIVLNGGGLKGLVKLGELEENLNQLKDYVETLKSATATGLQSVGAGTAANGATGKAAFDGAMAKASISFKDMEDKKVTH